MAYNIQNIIQLILNNLYLIGVLAVSTMGIALTFKTSNTINFSQASVSIAGAYMAGKMVRSFGASSWTAMIIGVAVCFIAGVLLDVLIMSHVGFGGRVMVTIALIVIINAAVPVIFGTIPYNFPRFFTEQVEFSMFGMQFNVTQNALFITILSAGVICAIFAALQLTKWGLGVRGTASNMEVAAMMGVNTNFMTALSWGISCALGALGAIMQASQTAVIDMSMLNTVQANSLLAFVLGGFTSFYGPVVGAVIIPIVNSLTAFINGIWASALLYIFVMLVILIKPNGLFGKAEQKKV